MNRPITIAVHVVLIVILAAIAAGAGVGLLWHSQGESYEFTTLRGETVEIYGQGLYRYDSVAIAAQEIAQDSVTLLLGIPLLVAALIFALRGSLRGKLLLLGSLGYFLYTYTSVVFGTGYNQLFLLYVVLFTVSLSAFIIALESIDVLSLPSRFSANLPRRTIALFCCLVGAFLLLSWLGKIVTALVTNTTPVGMGNSTTLFIQALDLGIIVPLAFLSAIFLLRKNALGYLLTSIVLLKGLTLSIAVTAMVIGQVLAKVEVSLPEMVMFPLLALLNIYMVYLLLKHVVEAPVTRIRVAGDGVSGIDSKHFAHDPR